MRWLNFMLVVFVALVIQSGVGRLWGLGQQRIIPDLLLLLTVVLALRGSGDKLPLACWVVGLVKDLSSDAVLGSYALGFALVGIVLVQIRELFYGDHPLALILLTLLSSLVVEHVMLLIAGFRGDFAWANYRQLLGMLVLSALFTGGLAPYGQWLLMKLYRQLGLVRQRVYG